MRNNFIFFIVMTLICLEVSSQQKRVVITGQISSDSIALGNIHIINKTSKKATISDVNGSFRIFVKEHDELLISGIQFNDEVITINKLNINTLKLFISLKKKINSLDEVTIIKQNSTAENLGLPNAGKKPLNKLESKLNYHTKSSIARVFLGILLNEKGSINDIYYITSGKRKKDRRLKNLRDKDRLILYQLEQIQAIKKHFKEAFFTKTLKLPTKEIDYFIKFCDSKNNVIYLFSKKQNLDIIDIFIQQSETYLKELKDEK